MKIEDSVEQKECEVCGDLFIPDGRRKSRCPKIHERDCLGCGASFILRPSMESSKKFCSYDCSNGSRTVKRICIVCGTSIARRAKTCSTLCATKLRNTTILSNAKNCEWCDQEFVGLSTKKYCSREHFSSCEVCKTQFVVNPYSPRRACSALCNGKLVNTPKSNELRKATSLEHWGTEYPFQSEEIKKKIFESNLDRYGVRSPLASKELREKGRETSLRNWGVEWHVQSPEGQAARIKTNLERYGFPNTFMVPEFIEKAHAVLNEKIAKGEANPRKISNLNRELREKIEAHFGKEVSVSFESPFGKYSADLGLEYRGKTLLVDLNPTISHNSYRAFICIIRGCEKSCEDHKAPPTSYHFNRSEAALAEDKTLIQWYGWESQDQLIRYLEGKLSHAKKISARKLQLRSITARRANEFLTENHIQGSGKGQVVCYGLFQNKELISAATFGPTRFGSEYEWEFIRYATKRGYVVHGGSGKLFQEFLKEKDPQNLVSYVDFNHTTRRNIFLQTIGFTELAPARTSLIWHRIADNRMIRNTSVLALGADRLLGTAYGSREESGLNNKEIMITEGFLPVYTAGNRVFVWRSHS